MLELHARLKACVLRFHDIERLAQRRAQQLKRLFAANPNAFRPRAGEGPHPLTEQQANSGGGPAYLIASPFEATAPSVPHQIALAATSEHVSLSRSGEGIGARCASNILVVHFAPTRAGLRVRAPP